LIGRRGRWQPIIVVVAAAMGLGAPASCRSSAPAAEPPPIRVDAEFPGGNIVVDGVEGDSVRVHQDLRDTPRDWFYWQFRVRGAAGRAVVFRFTRGPALGPLGPAASVDGGKSWKWLGPQPAGATSFRYRFSAAENETRFGFCIPYVQSDLDAFLKSLGPRPMLSKTTLCRSAKGRVVELLRLGTRDRPRHRVLLAARHHACETMADYVLEGLIAEVLAGEDDGAWLRRHVEFAIVPFMDKDGVEQGDQGKLRAPHDHWEDYAGESRYAEVKALRAFAPAWSQGRLRVALDVHCPARLDRLIYFAAPSTAAGADHLARLSAAMEEIAGRDGSFRGADNLPFGKGWNTAAYYERCKPFMLWAQELPGVALAATLEVPYAQFREQTVTVELARGFGRGLARALRRFLDSTRFPD
jgi:hypothetical protein